MIKSPPRTILEVFESLPEGTLAQLINNHIIMSPSPDYDHQDTVSDIARQSGNHVKENKLGKIIVAPMDVYFNRTNVYQPDIIFISNNQMDIIQDGKIKGAPQLIVEVRSPGTESYDRKEKKAVYEQSGVKEYWLVNPKSKKTTGYQLTENGYTEIATKDGIINSSLLGVTIQF